MRSLEPGREFGMDGLGLFDDSDEEADLVWS